MDKVNEGFGSRTRSITPSLQLVVIVGALVVTALGSFLAGYTVARPSVDNQMKVFNEAWNIIEQRFYYPKPSTTDRAYGAIHGLLSVLNDQHTIFMPPVAAKQDTAVMQGQVGGVGATVGTTEAGEILIIALKRGWPAEQAGVKPGDIIIAVDGKDVTKLNLADTVNLIKGTLGTTVTLTLKRKGATDPLSLTMTRGQINVYGTMLDGGVAYLSMELFSASAPKDITAALEKLLPQKPKALILDLRGNGGGYLNESLEIADLFLPQGIIATEKLVTGEVKHFSSKSGDLAEDIPMIVLVDSNSASASEIVAGALKDRKRAVLIGTQTFGKGSVQGIHILSDGSQLRVTEGAWYTPNETPIEHRDGQPGGLKPDILVELPQNRDPSVDLVLQAALKYLNEHDEIF